MAGGSRWANIGRRARAVEARRSASKQPRERGGRVHARFEGYGPGGAAVLIECMTDDPSGLGIAVRRAFAEHGGRIGARGSVSYLFNSVGLMAYPPGSDGRRLTRAAFAAGAEDVVTNDDTSVEVLTDPLDFKTVASRLSEQALAPVVAEITWRAASAVELSGEAAAEMLRLLAALEALGTGCEVYSNADIAAEETSQPKS